MAAVQIAKIARLSNGNIHVQFADKTGMLFNNLEQLRQEIQAVNNPRTVKLLALGYALARSADLSSQQILSKSLTLDLTNAQPIQVATVPLVS
jgi:hypothetical protein